MYIKIVAAVAAAVIITGCGAKPAPQTEASSHEATLVESRSSSEVMIRAKGEGESVERAMRDSELAALWYLLNGGDNPMLQNAQERASAQPYMQEINANSKRYIVKASGIKGKKVQSGKTYIDRVFVINKALLKEDLVAKGVMKSVEDLSEGLGTITVAVLPKDPNLFSDTQYQAAVDVISGYLQDRNYDVNVLKAQQKSNKIIQKAAMLSGVIDPMYALAMESGSDIYISVNLDKTQRAVAGQMVKKASVTLSAYYTATAKQVGAASGYSPERAVSGYTSVTQEATNDAIEKVLGQIQKSWKRESAKGKYFKVVVTAAEGMGAQVDRPAYEALKSVCPRLRRNGASNAVFDYTLQCSGVNDTMALLGAIEENYQGAGRIFREMDSGSLLVLKIANSADDELVIE